MAIPGAGVSFLTVTSKEECSHGLGMVPDRDSHLHWLVHDLDARSLSVCYLMAPDALKPKLDTLESLFPFRSLP